MSLNGTIDLTWSHGRDTFCLGKITQILDLEEKCGPIATVYGRLTLGTWGINDVLHVIRLGLVGAGMGQVEALAIVQRHVTAPLAPHAFLAAEIIKAVVVGVPGDEVGKEAAADQKAEGDRSTVMTGD